MVNYRVALVRNRSLGLDSALIPSRMESICFWYRIITADPLRSRLRIMESSFQLNHIDPDAQSSTIYDIGNTINIAAQNSQSVQRGYFPQNTSPVNLLHSEGFMGCFANPNAIYYLDSAYRTSLDPHFSNLSFPQPPAETDVEIHLINLSYLKFCGRSCGSDNSSVILAQRFDKFNEANAFNRGPSPIIVIFRMFLIDSFRFIYYQKSNFPGKASHRGAISALVSKQGRFGWNQP